MATAARGSIGTPVTRCTSVASFTTWAALANAASVLAGITDDCVDAKVRRGAVPYLAALPAAVAAAASVTAGSGS